MTNFKTSNGVNVKSVKRQEAARLVVIKRKCVYTGITGILFLLLTIILIAIDPQEILTKHLLKIENGSYVIKKMQQKLYSFSIQMYMFNVTNPEAFLSGDDQVLKLQEVGPFTYRELRTNTEMKINKEKNTLTYSPQGEISYVPEKSIGDPDKIVLNICNPIFLSAAAKASKENFLIKMGFNLLVNQINSRPIINITAQEMLWGYKYPLIEFGKTFVPGIAMFDDISMNDYIFGDNSRVRFEVDISDDNRFSIISVNGSGGITQLGFESVRKDCNTFTDAYEGLFFPSPINPKRRLRVYHKIFCRLLELEYVKNTTLNNGLEGMEYRISKDAFTHNVQNECHCDIGGCLKGISDTSPCFMDLPIVLSQGHFLDAEDRVFYKLEGLHPNEEDHGSRFMMHKRLGIPLSTRLTIQISIVMGDVSFSDKAKPFSNMIVPMGYGRVEQEPLPEDIHMMIQFVTFYFPKILLSIEIAFIVIGLSLLVYSLRLLYCILNAKSTQMQYCTENTAEVISSNETPLMTSSGEK